MTEHQSGDDSFSKNRSSDTSGVQEILRSSLKPTSHMSEPHYHPDGDMSQDNVNISSICGSSASWTQEQEPQTHDHEHRPHEQVQPSGPTPREGRGTTTQMDDVGTSAEVDRVGPGPSQPHVDRGPQDRVAEVGEQDQQGESQASPTGRAVPDRTGDPALRPRDDPDLGEIGDAEGLADCRAYGGGPGGVRQACGSGVSGHQLVPAGLPRVGSTNSGGGDRLRLQTAALGAVVEGTPGGNYQAQHKDRTQEAEGEQTVDSGIQLQQSTDDGTRHVGGPAEPCRHDPELAGRGRRAQGGTATEEGPSSRASAEGPIGDNVGGLHEGVAKVSVESSCLSDSEGYKAQGIQLSAGRASQIEQQSWEIVPGLFQGLVSYGGLVLLEVGGEPDSHVARAVQEMIGSADAAKRLSSWNGADLGSSEGVKLVLQQIGLQRPGVVWLSPLDSPFSPMQHTNANSDQQKEELQIKRASARKCFEGAASVYRYCVQQGIHCVWCMSEKSDAWRLPLLQNLQKQFPCIQAVTHGCQVDLRSRGGSKLLKKGWKLVTTHARLAQIMNMKCNCPKPQRAW